MAVYFANETSVEVARIEGGSDYKHFMHQRGSSSNISQYNRKCGFFPFRIQELLRFIHICPRQPDLEGTVSLFRSLKYAVDSYLGTNFCFVSVAVPDPDSVYYSDLIGQAIDTVGLRQVFPLLHAGEMAFAANWRTIEKDRNLFPDEQVVLTVDFSNSGLNLALFYDNYYDIRLVYPLRSHWVHELVTTPVEPPPEFWRDVRETVKTFVQPPFGESPMGRALPDYISQVVLYGDDVANSTFLDILRENVGHDVLERAHKFDPVFASAVGMAQLSYERMDAFYSDEKAAFGCKWRSELYGKKRPSHDDL